MPVEGREGTTAAPVAVPLRTQSTRAETALVMPAGGTGNDDARSSEEPFRARTAREAEGIAFIAELRGGGSTARDVREPLATVTAAGNHHMLVRHKRHAGTAGDVHPRQRAGPHAHDGGASVGGRWPHPLPAVEDCTFRMLELAEIQAAMAFRRDYRVRGTRREQVRQLGNAVTPPAAEWLIRAVVESLA
ncbi:DNA cytosine methyltransferase [Pseudonocardia nigra]|uniref:DNA cytosine methyltransferase n=1 Tax=Pseudonocardia nigra TaxID=1921578 RepID=UPI001C5DBEA2|nr:DNA cytosine methyltransferase [Pseudonocardia nigra]